MSHAWEGQLYRKMGWRYREKKCIFGFSGVSRLDPYLKTSNSPPPTTLIIVVLFSHVLLVLFFSRNRANHLNLNDEANCIHRKIIPRHVNSDRQGIYGWGSGFWGQWAVTEHCTRLYEVCTTRQLPLSHCLSVSTVFIATIVNLDNGPITAVLCWVQN